MSRNSSFDSHRPSLNALSIAFCASFLLAGAALSVPITYSFKGTASGSVGGSPFNNQDVTIVAVGDSATVANSSGGVCNNVTSVTVVSGTNILPLSGPFGVFDNQTFGNAGIWVGTCGAGGSGYDWFRVSSTQFTTYDLRAPIGPFSVTATYTDTTDSVNTSSGPLKLSGQSLNTFMAQSGGCAPDATTLCLFNRFQVRAQYEPYGSSTFVNATATSFSASTGFLTTVTTGDVDVVVKMVNFCSLNNSWSAYIGGTTDLGVQITITDTSTGQVYTASNPLGSGWALIRQVAFSCP